MAFSGVGSIGTGVRNTGGGSSCVITTTVAAEVGRGVILYIAKDNDATTDITTSEITSVSDSAGNTWTYIGSQTQSSGAADDGVGVELWYCARIGTELPIGGTITIVNNTDCDCAAVAVKITMGAGNVLSPVISSLQREVGTADAGALVISGLPSKEYWFVRPHAGEQELDVNVGVTTSYTFLPSIESSISGGAQENVGVGGEYRILTGTGDTSNMNSRDGDHADLFIAFEELPSGIAAVVAFTLTINPVVLRASPKLAAGALSYTYTPNAVTFRTGWALRAEPVRYTLAGNPVDFVTNKPYLPRASAGLNYTFYARNEVHRFARSGDTIYDGASTGTELRSTAQRSTLTLIATDRGKWFVAKKTGSWSLT